MKNIIDRITNYQNLIFHQKEMTPAKFAEYFNKLRNLRNDLYLQTKLAIERKEEHAQEVYVNECLKFIMFTERLFFRIKLSNLEFVSVLYHFVEHCEKSRVFDKENKIKNHEFSLLKQLDKSLQNSKNDYRISMLNHILKNTKISLHEKMEEDEEKEDN